MGQIVTMRALTFLAFDGGKLDKLWRSGSIEGRVAWCIAWEYGSRGKRDVDIKDCMPAGVGVDGVVDVLGGG